MTLAIEVVGGVVPGGGQAGDVDWHQLQANVLAPEGQEGRPIRVLLELQGGSWMCMGGRGGKRRRDEKKEKETDG